MALNDSHIHCPLSSGPQDDVLLQGFQSHLWGAVAFTCLMVAVGPVVGLIHPPLAAKQLQQTTATGNHMVGMMSETWQLALVHLELSQRGTDC